jgi:hypothetical protein
MKTEVSEQVLTNHFYESYNIFIEMIVVFFDLDGKMTKGELNTQSLGAVKKV